MKPLAWIIVLPLVLCACSTPPTDGSDEGMMPSDSTETATGDTAPEPPAKTVDSLETPVSSPAPLSVMLTDSGTILIGSPKASRLKIVTDYGCEYCRDFALSDRVWIESTYVASGKLALEIIFHPLSPNGKLMATLALCAAQSDAFLSVDRELAGTTISSDAGVALIAGRTGMKVTSLRSCMKSKKTVQMLAVHESIAKSLNVDRIPAFRIGDQSWIGLESRANLKATIEQRLHE